MLGTAGRTPLGAGDEVVSTRDSLYGRRDGAGEVVAEGK